MRLVIDPMSSKSYTIPKSIKGNCLLLIPSDYKIEDYDENSFYPDWVIVPEIKYPILIDLREVMK